MDVKSGLLDYLPDWTLKTTHFILAGYLKVVLSDPAYPSTPLFSCDVAVTCPHSFHLRFYLPSGDSPGLDRQVVASVEDSRQVYHLRLHRPAKSDMAGEEGKPAPVCEFGLVSDTCLWVWGCVLHLSVNVGLCLTLSVSVSLCLTQSVNVGSFVSDT